MKIKTLIIIGASFVAGAIAGALWSGHAFKKFEVAKEVDVAAQTAYDADTLAMLRLNEVTNAISSLEMQADAAVVSLAVWDQISQPDQETLARRNRFLSNIKVYHQSFPVKNNDTNAVRLINSFLDQIPGRNPTNTCQSAICRLDDLRLSTLNPRTNAAAR